MDLKAEQYPVPELENEPISSPDFEDETTLLSARPVIPLASIKTKSSSRRRVLPAALAFFLGVLAIGAVIQLRRNQNHSQRMLNSSTDSPTALSEKISEKLEAQHLPAASTYGVQLDAQGGGSTLAVQAQSESPMASAAGRSKTADSSFPGHKIRENNSSGNSFDIKSRRQLRREARRTARAVDRNTSDSLDGIFRIRDIFEGSRRP